jgi:hypothetical protein
MDKTAQLDAVAVIDALTAEIAELTRRAVIAEQTVVAIQKATEAATGSKESK